MFIPCFGLLPNTPVLVVIYFYSKYLHYHISACEDTPSGFLPHGGDAGDTEYVLGAVSGSVPSPVIVFTDWPYLAFGRSDTGTGVQLLQDVSAHKYTPTHPLLVISNILYVLYLRSLFVCLKYFLCSTRIKLN